VSPRAGVSAASVVLEHVPDLVRYGSKPRREGHRIDELTSALRAFEDAVRYPPNQVMVGGLAPESLWGLPRPWWRDAPPAESDAPFGEILDQAAFYDLLAEVDRFDLVRLKDEPAERELQLWDGDRVVGAVAGAHAEDEALSPHVMLENLACKASAVHALRRLLASHPEIDPGSITYVVNAGEEAVGDRYQRGGGALAKAVAEDAGLLEAGGSDVKAFCAGPIHALVVAGALVESRVHERVAVVAGSSLAKLGMKFLSALDRGLPILEDVLAGFAAVVGPSDDGACVLRLDAVGTHRVGSGSSQQALLEDIVSGPLERIGRRIVDVDRYATELHNPEITEPAGAGDIPDRNYRMLAGLGVVGGEFGKSHIRSFAGERGLPGYAPTQGHIASAVPWLPHALARFETGELGSTMLLAKGSLFLGRMTRLWDGASITLEASGRR
jgi:glycine/sarcosine/betaine reductase complex component C subunit beta